jgi:hypothetical protein
MPHETTDTRLKPLPLTLFVCIFAAAFFLLPYAVPVAPSVSASYVFQFNNRVATLIFLVGAAAFAIYFRGLSLRQALRDSRVSRTSAAIAITTCVAAGGLFYWLAGMYGITGESTYFISRVSLAAHGQTIYRDFEFPYGPLLVYLPLWTGKIFHLGLVGGYVLFWLIDWAAGIWILYRLVNTIEIESPYRTAIFFLLVFDLATGLTDQGINYAPVRTLLTAAAAMLVHAARRHGYPLPTVVCVAVASAAFAAALSPEFAIAFMLGTLVFFFVCLRPRPSRFWPSLLAKAACFAAIVAASQHALVYTTLHSMSSGAYNYPILPGIANLWVMCMYCMAACVAYMAFKQHRADSLAVYLLCICLFCMPSCFGRADEGHMQFAAFPALIVAILAIGNQPKLSIPLAALFLFVIYSQERRPYPTLREGAERRVFDPANRSELLHRPAVALLHGLHQDAHLEKIEAKVTQASQRSRVPDLELPPGEIFYAPLQYAPHGLTVTSGQVDYGYFLGLLDVFLPKDIQAILQWLKAHPERSLILPPAWQTGCYTFAEASSANMKLVYSVPFAPPQRREMRLFYPICDYLRSNYAPGDNPDPGQWTIWHPIPETPDPRQSAEAVSTSR